MQVAAVIAIVVILHVPLGNYMAAVYTSGSDLRVERAIYRLVGVQPDVQQRWTRYLSSLLAFSAGKRAGALRVIAFASKCARAVGA